MIYCIKFLIIRKVFYSIKIYMYKQKYLKYKSKYLQFKKLTGGTPELNAECEKQIKENGKYSECDKCKYFHNTTIEDPKTKTSQSICELPTGMKMLYGKLQADLQENIVFFNHPQNIDDSRKVLKYNTQSKTFVNEPSRNMLMDYKLYKSIKSYLPKEKSKITLYPEDIETFCAEGNIIWVSKNSKVGSAGIDSCMFVIIFLNDDTKICIHHNILDDSENVSVMGGIFKNMSNYTKLKDLFSNSCIDERVVNKIYLCFNNKENHEYYNNLIKIYRSLCPNINILSNYTRYLVDNNNDVYALKIYKCSWI
jgi:hypothetical protein